MKKVSELTYAQHRVHFALSVIEEAGLRAFFRAIREHTERCSLVDKVNAELDHGVGLRDLFAYAPSVRKVTDQHILALEVIWLKGLRCSIEFGLAEWDGPGAAWYVVFDAVGQVIELEHHYSWDPKGSTEGMEPRPNDPFLS